MKNPRPIDNPNKNCTIEGCTRGHYGRGLCNLHWQQQPHRRTKAAARSKIKDKTPVRKEAKRNAQMKYAASPKAILAFFHRWAKQHNKIIQISDEQLLEFRNNPCHKCLRMIEGIGIGFTLLKPRRPISLDNMLSTCGTCKLIKPKEQFNAIAFSKKVLRRFWKRTPMATIAKRKARVGRGAYECRSCKNIFKEKETQIDHIVPIVDPVIGYTNLEDFANRLFCDDNNLQLLCKLCHSKKTGEENAIRIGIKKDKK